MATLVAMVHLVILLSVLGSEATLLASRAEASATTRLLGYYDAKAQTHLHVEAIPHADLTHVVLANAVKVDNQGNLHFRPQKHDGELSAVDLIDKLASPDVPTRLIVSIRGHPDDVALDELSENETVRERFVTDLASRVRDWGVAGVEIEWHADDPAGGKPNSAPFEPLEQQHLMLLCRELSGTLRAAGQKTLSVAVRPGRKEFPDGEFVRNHVDWLMLRAYSMRSLGDPHHSSLKDMEVALAEWSGKGVPAKQLVLGTPLFGRPGHSLHRAGDRNEALRQSWLELSSTKGFSPARASDGMQGDVWRDESSGKAWWFSGLETTRSKATHVFQNGFGGLAFRDLNHDVQKPELSIVHAAAAATRRAEKQKTAGVSLFQRSIHRSSVTASMDDEL